MNIKNVIKKTSLLMTIGLFIFLFITVFIPYINFSCKSDKVKSNMKNVISVAHRGASTLAPENTLSAFKLAIRENIDIIELDIHLSKDDSIVVLHDYNFKRISDVDRDVEEMTYDQISKLNAGKNFKDGLLHERVPTLNEVLQLVAGRKKVLIELKWPRKGLYKNLVDKTLDCIRKNEANDWVIIQSFEKQYLKEVLSKDSTIECHQLVFGFSNILPIFYDTKIRFGRFFPLKGITSVNLFYMYLSASFVKQMHKQNIKVMVFTLDDKKKINKAINLGVDGIISNNASIIGD